MELAARAVFLMTTFLLAESGHAARQLPSNTLLSQSSKSVAVNSFNEQHTDWQRASFAVLKSTMASNKSTEEIAPTVTALLKVLDGSYPEQLIALMQESLASPGGLNTFTAVLEEMIAQSNCGHVLPLIHELYPHASLVSQDESFNGERLLQNIAARHPKLAQCVLSGP